MTPGQYFIASSGGTEVKVDNSKVGLGKVTKTYTTQYSNIRRKTGGICPKCFEEEYRKFKNEWLIAGLACLAVGVGCAVFFILCLAVPSMKESIQPGVKFLGLAGALAGGYFALKCLPTALSISNAIDEIKKNSKYTISTYLVSLLKQNHKTECTGTEELMTLLKREQLR